MRSVLAWLRHFLGLIAAAAAVYGLYWLWLQTPWLIRQIPGGPWRAMANDFRLLVEILGAFLALATLDWIWRKMFSGSAGADQN